MPWAVDIDFSFTERSPAVTRLSTISTQAGWKHLGVWAKADGTFSLDTDWEYEALSAALAKIGDMADEAGFTGASLKMT